MADLFVVTASIIGAWLKPWVEQQNPKPSAEDILRKAYEMSFEESYTWMLRRDQMSERFSAANAAAYTLFEEDDKQKLRQDLEALRTLGALVDGVPVVLGRFVDQMKTIGEGSLKPMKLFNEAREAYEKIHGRLG